MTLGLYQPSAGERFLFEPTPGFYGFISQGSIPALNDAMRLLADHILAPTSPIIEPWEGSPNPLTILDHDWTKDDKPPGMIRYDGPLRSRIQIAITNKHSPYLLGAILAHELSHHFLANKGIGYPDQAENERLTDFATVFLGLGKLTVNGYTPVQWSIPRGDTTITYTYHLGYLSVAEMADILYRVCALRRISLDKAEANLSPTALGIFRVARLAAEECDRRNHREELRRAKRLRRREKLDNFLSRIGLPRQRAPMDTETPRSPGQPETPTPTRTIQCPQCGQSLRIPQTDRPIRVRCPTCSNTFQVRTRMT